jgi:hypothetical protein
LSVSETAPQPELSKILGGKFTEVSVERLMRFLTALGCHIEIKIGAGQENKAGDVTIKDVRRTAALAEPPLIRSGSLMRHPAAVEEPRRRYRTKSYSGARDTIRTCELCLRSDKRQPTLLSTADGN